MVEVRLKQCHSAGKIPVIRYKLAPPLKGAALLSGATGVYQLEGGTGVYELEGWSNDYYEVHAHEDLCWARHIDFVLKYHRIPRWDIE